MNFACLTYSIMLLCGFPCFVHMGLRRDVRRRYNIEGSNNCDLYVFPRFFSSETATHCACIFSFPNSCCTWCCIPCTLTQESREIELEELSITSGYTA